MALHFGRQLIYTDYDHIDASNVVEVLSKALVVFQSNQSDIRYLYDYWKGNQPVLSRVKEIRPEICNRIVVNRANEIVAFKTGYLMGEPVQYVNRGTEESATDAINVLNEYMFAEDKAAEDEDLAEWFSICGTAYRMILPDREDNDEDGAPFHVYTLDPRYTFVVRNSGLGNPVVMAVKFVVTEEHGTVYSIYTDREYFEVVDGNIVKQESHILGEVPIIEYPANKARLGDFEIVLDLLDAINLTASNRLDGVEQFIQSLMVFEGVDVDADDFQRLKQLGGVKVPENGDVRYLVQELNQTQTQTLIDDMYQTVLTICGMPNRNGGTSTSDTGSAVIMRDGWSAAESRAKRSELMFKKSEKQFLRLVLRIVNTLRGLNLKLSDIEIRFTRRNYENIQEKSQVLTTMLANSKIHPRLAFAHCGMFADPEVAYTMSMEYAEEQQKELVETLAEEREGTEAQVDDDESEDRDV